MDNEPLGNRTFKPAAAPQSGVFSSILNGTDAANGGLVLTYTPVAGDPIVRVSCEGILTLRGRAAGTEPLKDSLGNRCYSLRVFLNMEKIVGVETSGISWLVQTAEKFKSNGGRLVAYCVPAQVTSLLQMLEMEMPFTIATNFTNAQILSEQS